MQEGIYAKQSLGICSASASLAKASPPGEIRLVHWGLALGGILRGDEATFNFWDAFNLPWGNPLLPMPDPVPLVEGWQYLWNVRTGGFTVMDEDKMIVLRREVKTIAELSQIFDVLQSHQLLIIFTGAGGVEYPIAKRVKKQMDCEIQKNSIGISTASDSLLHTAPPIQSIRLKIGARPEDAARQFTYRRHESTNSIYLGERFTDANVLPEPYWKLDMMWLNEAIRYANDEPTKRMYMAVLMVLAKTANLSSEGMRGFRMGFSTEWLPGERLLRTYGVMYARIGEWLLGETVDLSLSGVGKIRLKDTIRPHPSLRISKTRDVAMPKDIAWTLPDAFSVRDGDKPVFEPWMLFESWKWQGGERHAKWPLDRIFDISPNWGE